MIGRVFIRNSDLISLKDRVSGKIRIGGKEKAHQTHAYCINPLVCEVGQGKSDKKVSKLS